VDDALELGADIPEYAENGCGPSSESTHVLSPNHFAMTTGQHWWKSESGAVDPIRAHESSKC
jgi:hypothetical protein